MSRPAFTAITSSDYLNEEKSLNDFSKININLNTLRALLVTSVDSSGNPIVPVGVNTAVADGNKAVATAGTAVPLTAATTAAKEVTINAADTNTGVIVVGGTTVVAAAATRRGIPLWAGDTIKLNIDDLNKVYIDSTVNGEKVTFIYLS